MAKRLDKFTKPFQASRVAFLLSEVITNGAGEMVDLVCRFANAPAAALLDADAADLSGQRFTHSFPPGKLAELEPLATVAFSGSASSFSYVTVLGRELSVTCYQPMYGLAACILEEVRRPGARDPSKLLTEALPGAVAVIELGRDGVRNLSFNRRLCDLTGYGRKEFLSRFSDDFSALVEKADWPDLLQDLLDAARSSRPVHHEFRLVRKSGGPLWMDLRAEKISAQGGTAVFYAALLNVDRQKRDQARLEEALRQLENTRDRLHQLFDHLPGSYCVFRLPAPGVGAAEPVWGSRELAQLLGLLPEELAPTLLADPLAMVPPADRPGLLEAVERVRAEGTALRHTFRLQRMDGALLWLALDATGRPQPDGSFLLYTAVKDMTVQRQAEADLRSLTELYRLLLNGSDVVLVDYDPAGDVVQIELPDREGRRTVRTIPGYLAYLKNASSIHPEDRNSVAAALRRMSVKPGAHAFEFRGNLGLGWRWFRVSGTSLFDEQGTVYRVLGKVEDLTERRAAAERFQGLRSHYDHVSKGALAAVRLDLSADRLLDARGKTPHLTRVLFGNTAGECLRGIQENLPDPAEQAQFGQLFSREALLDAFCRGSSHFGLQHLFSMGDGSVIQVRSMLEIAENPDTRRVEAFLSTVDTDLESRRAQALDTLLRRELLQAMTVDPATGRCRPLTGDGSGGEVPYAALNGPPLLEVLAVLAEQDSYSWGNDQRQLRFFWLDETHRLLLVTDNRM